MESCALCESLSQEAALTFHHVRKAERVWVELPLCEVCANRLEKHLKRMIPKRLMAFSRLAPTA